jgi:hypothetical protein
VVSELAVNNGEILNNFVPVFETSRKIRNMTQNKELGTYREERNIGDFHRNINSHTHTYIYSSIVISK